MLVAVVASLLAGAVPAKACQCVPGDPRDRFAEADGAMIGTVVSRRPATDENGEPSPSRDVVTFRVDEAFKGDLGETVDVYTSSQESTCGLSIEEGHQLGLLMSYGESSGTWGASACDAIDPDELRRAAAPLPEPDGRGRARVLVGGSWGESSYMALDARGRTLGYGLGDRSGVRLEVCPGARRFLEIDPGRRGWRIALRSMRSNRLIETTRIPSSAGPGAGAPVHAIACGGPSGRAILVARIRYEEGDRWGRIERVRGRERERLYSGQLHDAVFPGYGVAYLQRGGRIIALDLSSELLTRVAWFRPRWPRGLEVSPDGTRLATLIGPDVFVADLTADTAFGRDVRPERYARVAWMDDDRLVLFPEEYGGRVAVLHADRGRPRLIEGEWFGDVNVVSGGFAYGLTDHLLSRVGLPDGPVEHVRSFDSPEIGSLTAVEPPRRVGWPPPP